MNITPLIQKNPKIDQSRTRFAIKYANTRKKVEKSLPQIANSPLIGPQSLGATDSLSYHGEEKKGSKPCITLIEKKITQA